jgi:hypothetical protein
MIRRAADRLRIDPAKPKIGQIQFLNKDVDRPNGIVLADPIFQAFRKQRALPRPTRIGMSLINLQPAREMETLSRIAGRV